MSNFSRFRFLGLAAQARWFRGGVIAASILSAPAGVLFVAAGVSFGGKLSVATTCPERGLLDPMSVEASALRFGVCLDM